MRSKLLILALNTPFHHFYAIQHAPVCVCEQSNIYIDDVPIPLPLDRHKLPTITSSLASMKSFTAAMASPSPSATNEINQTDNSSPCVDSASSMETLYKNIETRRNNVVTVDEVSSEGYTVV